MKKLLFFCCLLLSASLHAQVVSFGQQDSVYSNILKENRPLWIYAPPSEDTNYFLPVRYPVLYVIDGDAHFATLQTMIEELGLYEGNTVIPRMIIVGIKNTNGRRMPNLTPTEDTAVKGSGGGEDFIAFMEKELMPYIEKKYNTAPYSVLIGHSLGGLMTAHILLHHRELFNAYIATDPSIFWNHGALLSTADRQLRGSFKGRTFFMGIAHPLNPLLDTATVRSNTDFGSIHTSAILSLSEKLKSHPDNQLRWSYKYYPDDDHHSVPFIAIYDGLRFIFPHHRFAEYLYTDDSPADSIRQLVISHFDQLSADMGYPVLPSEAAFNYMGYNNLFSGRPDKARMLFELNIRYFPKSFNVYDSMGDYYKETHNLPEARKYWQQALNLKYTKEIAQKLEAK